MLEGLKILLAEDNPTNQLVAVQMLSALGADVTVAADGIEALETLETDHFDVLLVDIEMPRLNGLEVITRLRRGGGQHAQVPMIALTAYVMREHRQAIDAAGADGVIAKPIISIAEFGEQVLRLSARRLGKRRNLGESAPCDGRGKAGIGGSPPPSEAEVLNRAALDTLGATIGQPALDEILEKAEIDIRANGTRLERGLEEGDYAEVRAAAHILAGLAGTIGAERLEADVRMLQDATRSGDMRAMADAGRRLRSDIEAALAALADRARV